MEIKELQPFHLVEFLVLREKLFFVRSQISKSSLQINLRLAKHAQAIPNPTSKI
ncbi:MAG: hypothetical protein RMX96_18170 [Nostoc sp. ChiSLP02]|nr:hypothetical protein [Nostoc sp. DedSLP05]MDZ8097626.1 hypothetical protein [Nostoc sp. DedSLP01]MDZ8186763.1 hypothetical protein [Nostoc sp. ChiSLP02]